MIAQLSSVAVKLRNILAFFFFNLYFSSMTGNTTFEAWLLAFTSTILTLYSFEQTDLLDRLGRSSLYWTSWHGWQGEDCNHLYKVRVAQWTYHRLHQWQALLDRCPSKLYWVCTQEILKQPSDRSCQIVVGEFIGAVKRIHTSTHWLYRKLESKCLE